LCKSYPENNQKNNHKPGEEKMKFRSMSIIAVSATALIFSASAQAFKPSNTECIAPANAGGGWDLTCRLIGKTMQDLKLIPGAMQVTNKAGAGGGVAFAEVVNKRNRDDNLIIAASSATTTRLAQNQFAGSDYKQVKWLGAVGSDYGVIAVAENAPYKTLPELLAAVKANPTSITFAGGSAVGGWDHLKVLIAAKKAGITDVRKVKYVSFDGGGDAVTQLMAGKVQAFTGDASEAKGFSDAGKIRVLAVLAPKRMSGDFAKFPTAKEQGLDVVGANWRGFYVPGGMSADAYAFWTKQLNTVASSKEWKAQAAKNGLELVQLSGLAFEKFVAENVEEIRSLSKEIGLLK
jgi:putative tricarboxylic transport membrane protein